MKKPPIEKDDAAKMITMLKHIMRLNPYTTNTQITDLGSHYHLSRGDHRLSQLFMRICMKNKSIYEQALKEVCQKTVGLDWLSINAVVKLKRWQDSVDPYHIYVVPLGLRKIPRQHRTFDASGEEAGWLYSRLNNNFLNRRGSGGARAITT